MSYSFQKKIPDIGRISDKKTFQDCHTRRAQRDGYGTRYRAGCPSIPPAKPFADRFQFEHGVEVPGATHGAFRVDQGIQREHPDDRAVEVDRLAAGQAGRIMGLHKGSCD